MLWERVAVYLGFTEFDACKVMGLAAYGNPGTFAPAYHSLFRIVDRNGESSPQTGPPFVIDPRLARFRAGDVNGLESLFGPKRTPDEPPETQRFADVAAGLQARTEEAILALARRLATATGERDLVYAGGVALNCVANTRLEREGPFRSLYVFGAAHDAGTAVGAALDVAHHENARLQKSEVPDLYGLTPFLGVTYDDGAIDAAIARSRLSAVMVDDPASLAASLLAAGQIVGWFQGRMEFGPRALGGRSLLADPRRAEMRDLLNRRIKHRESFRPFGASVLAEDAADWFEVPREHAGAASCRDLMILAYPVCPGRASLIPAVIHRDGTCRLQLVSNERAPLFHTMIAKFRELSGVPLVLNTSFNDQEPLVASPDDALRTLATTKVDALFLGDRLVRRVQ
jgi:carbamoyltransferase